MQSATGEGLTIQGGTRGVSLHDQIILVEGGATKSLGYIVLIVLTVYYLLNSVQWVFFQLYTALQGGKLPSRISVLLCFRLVGMICRYISPGKQVFAATLNRQMALPEDTSRYTRV